MFNLYRKILQKVLVEMEKCGYLERLGTRVLLTESGRLLADAIGQNLMSS